ncbi:MAG: hypothetical protein H0U57_05425 [Tatlockia sp.]|nr:hypothetical protein [Tatlockia sp.]
MYSKNEDFEKDILKSEDNLKIKRVCQESYLAQSKITLVSGGICGGISTVHIITQLSAKQGEVINPFDNQDLMQKSANVQYEGSKTPHSGTGFKLILEKELSLRKKRIRPEFCFHESERKNFINQFENKLKDKIEETSKDKKGRGIFIGTVINKLPTSDQKIYGAHAISMTTQIDQNNNLYCTGLDSNFFFASAKDKDGCNKLAEMMAKTINAYDTKHVETFTAELK